MKNTATSTKDRILDAAEGLFAEQGLAATSLRSITAAAGANQASVHYYFRTKEVLVEHLIERRLGPLNQERLALLEQCEASARRHPKLEDVLRIFMGPPLRMSRDQEGGGDRFMRLLSRTYAEPGDHVREVVFRHSSELVRRFTAAIGKALPKLGQADLAWRVQGVIGVLSFAMGDTDFIRVMAGEHTDVTDANEALERLLPFVVAGLSAPSYERPREAR